MGVRLARACRALVSKQVVASVAVVVTCSAALPAFAHASFPAASGNNYLPNTRGGTGAIGSTLPYDANTTPTLYLRVPFEQVDPYLGSDDTTVDIFVTVPAPWTNATCGSARTEILDTTTNFTPQPGSVVSGWTCVKTTVSGHQVLHWHGPQVVAPKTYLDSAQWVTLTATTPSPAVQTTYNGATGTEGFIVDQRYASGDISYWIPNAAFPGSPPAGANVTVAAGLARTVYAGPQLISSDYDASEVAFIDSSAAKLGVDRVQYQYVSVNAIAFILGISGVTGPMPTPPPPGTGAATITTTWSPADYPVLQSMATMFAVTPAQAQKICGLVVAFLLSFS